MSLTTVSEVVQAFSTSFKTVDLRIVAVVPENHWINVISSVFLSSKSQEEIKSDACMHAWRVEQRHAIDK